MRFFRKLAALLAILTGISIFVFATYFDLYDFLDTYDLPSSELCAHNIYQHYCCRDIIKFNPREPIFSSIPGAPDPGANTVGVGCIKMARLKEFVFDMGCFGKEACCGGPLFDKNTSDGAVLYDCTRVKYSPLPEELEEYFPTYTWWSRQD